MTLKTQTPFCKKTTQCKCHAKVIGVIKHTAFAIIRTNYLLSEKSQYGHFYSTHNALDLCLKSALCISLAALGVMGALFF